MSSSFYDLGGVIFYLKKKKKQMLKNQTEIY